MLSNHSVVDEVQVSQAGTLDERNVHRTVCYKWRAT